tara:strand:+ start:454 stop:885 length:432 start_codon:yes stop_codon:yes gene_type:complete
MANSINQMPQSQPASGSDKDDGYDEMVKQLTKLISDINDSVNSFFGVPNVGDIMDKGLDLIGQGLGKGLNMVSGGMSSMASSQGDSVMGMLSGQDKKAESDNKSSSPSPEGMQNIMGNSGGGSEVVGEVAETVAENPEMLALL